MALKLLWTKRSERKFEIIFEYLTFEWGDRVAGSFVKNVYSFLELLTEYPRIGTLQNKEKGIRAFTILNHVSIFYRISRNKIILLDFFDNRQNPKKKRYS